MERITAFIGSERKKATYQAVQEFERNLKQHGEIEFEYVFLNEYNLGFCKGCKQCFDKGEEFCSLKDDRDVLLDKMEHSDGVIFATPNYAFQVSARMKNFIDRFAYIFHRPRFFGKTFSAIVTQGIFGGDDILKYLESTGANLGFNVIKGSCITALEPMTQLQQKKLKQKIKKFSERFYEGLRDSKIPVPSFFRLMIFRMARTSIQSISIRLYDYYYYKDKGWFKSDYYHETTLGPMKMLAGKLFDFLGRKMAKNL